jgi:exonuclease SbcC
VIPVELELHNFLAYREPDTLRLEGMRIACLAGPNGAGKSSILDAITWALWGKARSNTPDELIHQGQDNMKVSLTFDYGESRYRVIRQRNAGKRGATLLEFQVWDPAPMEWRGLSEATLRATQNRIETLLRMDYETFVNSAFLMQGRADEFTSKTPNQRKQILSNILGLSRWEIYENRAKEEAQRTRLEIQRLDGRLEEIDREISHREEYEAKLLQAEATAEVSAARLQEAEARWADVEQTRNQLIALQQQIDLVSQRIRKTEAEISEMDQELRNAQERSDKSAITAALAEIRNALHTLEPLQIEQFELTKEITALSNEISHLKGINAALAPETEPITQRLATLEAATSPVCPTCGQALTEEHRRELVARLEAEIEGRREQFKENRARIQALEAQSGPLNRQLAQQNQRLAERPQLEKKAGELGAALQHAEEAARQVSALMQKIDRWKKSLQGDQEQVLQLEGDASRSRETLQTASISKTDIERLRLEKRMTDEMVGGARQQLAALSSLEEQRTKLLHQRDHLADDLGLYEDLREAFGKRGVPAMIIETAVPELERSANELLARMTDGRMAVRIETQREIKSGELREALDIIISDELGTRPYDLYSGGESFRVDFAVRIALSQLLARRAGAQLRSLFIDEGFGTQDSRGREQLVAAINSIQDDFDLILVITHIEEMKDAFPTHIEVIKTPQGSQFQLN